MTHEWKPLDELDLTSFSYPVSARNGYRNTVCASSSGLAEYCEGRRKQCEDDCLRSSRPFSIGHLKYTDTKIQPWRIARSWWCPRYCLEQSIACNKGRGEWAEQYAAEFDEIEPAVDWIKNHREEILVGTVIVIAGVAFTAAVVATSGGALILVPLVLMAENSPGALPITQLAESTR
ncbi:MAG TPA: hypothetical protein VLQ93_21160 [Myxococcaceae bacterium]|nr:hypothetical protein [Myxococcaceae bacterium]